MQPNTVGVKGFVSIIDQIQQKKHYNFIFSLKLYHSEQNAKAPINHCIFTQQTIDAPHRKNTLLQKQDASPESQVKSVYLPIIKRQNNQRYRFDRYRFNNIQNPNNKRV